MSIEEARQVLKVEEQGLAAVRARIGEEFNEAVEAILSCPSRLIITGIGKSGLVGQKISATLNSTGTPSFFLHPVEAMHGDLGMVTASDVVIAISYSGESTELNALLISLKKRGNTIIAMTGGKTSSLAGASDIVLDIHVPKEACPLGLAPTASTTATLAMGDALAVVLLNRKQFRATDFRKNHPGGSLGERLKVNVSEVMQRGDSIPRVLTGTPAIEAVGVLNSKNLGAVLIIDRQSRLVGIITDGDVRRAVAESSDLSRISVEAFMTTDPITSEANIQAVDALSILQQHEITILPIVNKNKELLGILHLHNLLGKGEFRLLV